MCVCVCVCAGVRGGGDRGRKGRRAEGDREGSMGVGGSELGGIGGMGQGRELGGVT